MPAPTLEGWAEIRFAYEHTKRTVDSICAEHGISSGTLRDRMKRWNWRRRQLPVTRDGPPAMAAVGHETASHDLTSPPTPLQLAAASRGDPPHPEPAPGRAPGRPGWEGDAADTSPAATVTRLQGAVSRVLSAIEAMTERLAAGRHSPREMERAGRTLITLTRTLRDLTALLALHGASAGAVDDDPVPRNVDEFRAELARRIRGFIDSRAKAAGEAKPAEPC